MIGSRKRGVSGTWRAARSTIRRAAKASPSNKARSSPPRAALRALSDGRMRVILLVAAAVTGLTVVPLRAQDTTSGASRDTVPLVTHGDNGFELRTRDGSFLMQIAARLQFRYAYPGDADPVTHDDFTDDPQHVFKVNRARLKVGGNGYRPWLKYYFEYELAAGNLLDFRVMVERFEGVRLKVGQWKVQYNRERVISSGSQQLADRSLINRAFTVDRQQGVSLYGRFVGGGAADLSYWVSVFTGTGRGNNTNDDKYPMWMGRLQWNPFGRVLAFTGSDIVRRQNPEGSIAFGALTNQSPYTRFSQAGGGQLEGAYRANTASSSGRQRPLSCTAGSPGNRSSTGSASTTTSIRRSPP